LGEKISWRFRFCEKRIFNSQKLNKSPKNKGFYCITVAVLRFKIQFAMMKAMLALYALCFVLFTTTGILHAFQDKWVLTAIWWFGACCWAACFILHYKKTKKM
jgi:hypothetical protein